LDLVSSGYVGLARQISGVNLCALTDQETLQRWGPSLDDVLFHFMAENPVLQNHLKVSSRSGPWMTVGPVKLGIRRLARESTFYVGDAACVVDPFVGEGMSMGLYSSRLLRRALDQTRSPADEVYSKLWRKAFMPALRWNAVMRLLYSIPVIREFARQALVWYPRGLNFLTDLTRYRHVAGEEA